MTIVITHAKVSGIQDSAGAAADGEVLPSDWNAQHVVSGQIGLANGGTNADLSQTGGASNVLKQNSTGSPVTVGQLAASDLSNATTGTGKVVLATNPVLTTMAEIASSSAAGEARLERDQNLASGNSAGLVSFYGQNASGTLKQWATVEGGASNRVAGTVTAGSEEGAVYVKRINGAATESDEFDSRGLVMGTSHDIILKNGRGYTFYDGNGTPNQVFCLSYNYSGAVNYLDIQSANSATSSPSAFRFIQGPATGGGVLPSSDRIKIGTDGNVGFGAPHNIDTFPALMSVTPNAAAIPAAPAGTLVHAANADGTSTRVLVDAYGAGIPLVTGRRAGGTSASQTATQNADNLLSIGAIGHTGSGYSTAKASIDFYAAQTWTTTANGTRIAFTTTASGGTSATEKFSIENDGGLITTSVTGGSKGSGTINAAGLYVSGVQVAPNTAAWSTWTPTISATAGTITTSSAPEAKYSQVGKTVHYQIIILVTTNGTGAGQLTFSLPVTAGANQYMGCGYNPTRGATVTARINAVDANHASVYAYDGTYPVTGSSQSVIISGTYEAA